MGRYILRRILYMIPTMVIISMISFAIIQAPPGDYLTTMLANMAEAGGDLSREQVAALRAVYGLDEGLHVQYWRWITNILLHGNFGYSFEWGKPVSALIWERLGWTFVISLLTLLFTWLVALPIGILSAVRRYSLFDYSVTFVGFIGLAVPHFMAALVLMYVSLAYFGTSVGGLFSPEFLDAPWSAARAWDLALHLWIPVLVLGLGGTAQLVRIMRANLSDELSRPYVVTARAKGLSETTVLLRYPVRVALNPFISTVGWVLPALVSGATVTAIALNLPTSGPLLLRALLAQDMYLAGAFVLMLSILTLIGTLASDILLAALDPRVRLQ
jgi:peptide/nickel transport system permease protein